MELKLNWHVFIFQNFTIMLSLTINKMSRVVFLRKASLGTFVIPPFLMSCGNTSSPTLKGGITEATIERLKKVLKRGFKSDRLP